MNTKSRAYTLYRTIWRWHFYAGLFCIPFILSLSVTGAIYLFKPQIEALIDRPYMQLNAGEMRATPEAHIKAAEQAIAGARFSSYRLPQNDLEAVVITVMQAGKSILVYVNPYTLDVLKTVGHNDQFMRVVRTLHGELLLGNTGSIMVELAGCWAIVMILTGLYLWWPRSASGIAGVIYPRISKGNRTFWRDLHAVTGFWVAIFTLFLLVSGLPWALVWGTAFKEIRAIGNPAVQQDWTVSNHHASPEPLRTRTQLSQHLMDKAVAMNFAPPVEFKVDKTNPQQWKLSSNHQNRTLRADAWFDGIDGNLVKTVSFSDRKTVDKVIGVGIAAHEGHLFGWLNQLLGLLVTLGLIAVSISGFVLWRKRKPKGVLGAPPAIPNAKVGTFVVVITLLLAMFLPLLAASLALLWLFEKFILPNAPRVNSWLGNA